MLRVICCNRIGLLPQRGQVVFHENETAGRTQLPTPLQAGISASPAEKLAHIYRHAGYPVFVTSAETGEGIDALREAISGKLAVFTGNSGVGKSSILNALCPELKLPVGEVSEKLGRGRHTTRHIELYCLGNGTFVADTPGFSSFDTERMDLVLKDQLQYAFSDFAPYLGKCQFQDCAHLKEPGCAVRAALERGEIEPTRYESYKRGEMRPLDGKAPVSMNMFGFTPDYFDYSEKYFSSYLKDNIDNPKSEFYIPTMVNKLVNDGTAQMRVLHCPAQWFGVTYKEDRPAVVERIRKLIAAGNYPEKLWK